MGSPCQGLLTSGIGASLAQCVICAWCVHDINAEAPMTYRPSFMTKGLSFDEALSRLRDAESPTHISADAFVSMAGCQQQELAEMAHVHRNTVRNNPHSPDLQRHLRDSVRVLQAASNLRGSLEEALFWHFNHPIRDFERKTAARLVSEGKVEAVLGYLESLQAGATA